MLSDLEVCDLLQAQYNGQSIFDFESRTGVVSVAVRRYPDCTAVLFEGSHNAVDWLSNAQFLGVPVDGLPGLIEAGFYDDMPETRDVLHPWLQPDKPVISAGHSRGAAHANIYARMLLAFTWQPSLVRRVKFGEPHSMDSVCARGFAESPAVSYRNYGSPLDQDLVCTVPFFPLVSSEYPTLVNVPAADDDPWLALRRHHLFLYRKALA